ncbi:MAG: PspC domain-containing protein [Patescibacteria group bacterium]
MNDKKLYRSSTDKMLTGVCGGIGEYFEMDSTVIRLVWALVVVFTGFVPGLVVYILAAVVMPMNPGAVSASTSIPVPPVAPVEPPSAV